MNVQWMLPAWGWPLLVLAALACWFWARRMIATSVPSVPAGDRRLLTTLRTLACIFVLLALARPLLVTERATDEPALVAVVLEDSGSMALRDHLDQPSRWDQAVAVAAAVDSLLSAHGEGARTVVLRGNGRGPLDETDLTRARVDTPRAVGSDLPTLVASARQRLLARPLRGVVVITDGHSDNAAVTTGPSATPLWLVGVGDPEGPADRRLADLRYPDAVHAGEAILVEVAVAQHGATVAADDSVTVRLLHEGLEVATRTGPAGDLTRWELTWTPDEPGLVVLTVTVDPLDAERFRANNQMTLAVDASEAQARLLLLGATAGWDARFLAQAALAEPRLALTTVRAGPEGPVLADSLRRWEAPSTVAAWRDNWDGVVMTGSPAALLPDGGAVLADAVRAGLGLLVLTADAGSDEVPRSLTGPLVDLLPVQERGGAELLRGEFALGVASAALLHPVMADLTDGAQLGGLPPLRGVRPAVARTGAQVLLETGERPLLVAVEREAGRVLWFGGRRLWELAFRHRSGPADTDHPGKRLLRQMLLWTALGDRAGGIALLGQRLLFEEGEPIPVATRWRDLSGDPVLQFPVSVEATGDREEIRRFGLTPDPARPGVATGTLPPLRPGRWRLVPYGESDPEVAGTAREVVVTRAERERTQVRQDRRGLRQIAARLGGTAIGTGRSNLEATLLPQLAALDLTPRRSVRQQRFEPATTWGWLALAVGLLAAEWLLRRRRGLL